MGCGSSAPVQTIQTDDTARDEEDFFLEPVQLQETLIAEFDGVFARAQNCLNRVVLLNDNISDIYEETRQALAQSQGAYLVEMGVGISCDSFVVDLARSSDGFRPSYIEVIKLNSPAVRQADSGLARAREDLTNALQTHASQGAAVRLRLIRGNCLALDASSAGRSVPELDEYNSAVCALDDALGWGYRVVTILRKAGHVGAKALMVKVMKARRTEDLSESEALVASVLDSPATLMDTCSWPHSALIKEGELAILEKSQALAWLLKDTPVEYDLSHNYRVTLDTKIEDEQKLAALAKMVQGTSMALFKLAKGCLWVKGSCSMDRVVFEVLEGAVQEVRVRYVANPMIRGYGLKVRACMWEAGRHVES